MTKHVKVTFLLGFIFLPFYLFFPLTANPGAEVTSFKLSNGLQVILSPQENIEAACVLLYHLTGVRDDPPEIRGASYLYQNLMLLGTRNFDAFDRMLALKRNGGFANQIVDYDYSMFYQVVPGYELDNALWLESERISSLQLNSRNLNIEKNNVYTRNYRAIHSDARVRALNWVKSKLFEGSIYETPIYGDLEKIQGFNPEMIQKLYDNFRDLSNIIMVIAGKFDSTELRKSLDNHFGNLPSTHGLAPRNLKKSYNSLAPRKELVSDNWLEPNLPGCFAVYGILGPSKLNLDHLYFDCIRFYLADKRISRLEEILNQEHNLDVTIKSEFFDYFEASGLIIEISAQRRANLERAKYFVNKQLDDLQKDAVSGAEVSMTRSLMEIDFMKKMTALETRSAFLAESYHLSGNLKGEENHLKRIRKITNFDLLRIAKKYLGKNNRTLLNVYPGQ